MRVFLSDRALLKTLKSPPGIDFTTDSDDNREADQS